MKAPLTASAVTDAFRPFTTRLPIIRAASTVRWLQDESHDLKQLEQVVRASSDWEQNGQSADWLAHQGARLDDAEKLMGRDDFKSRLGPRGESYLVACRARQRAIDDERTANERDRERAAQREREDAQRLTAAARDVKQSAERVKQRSMIAVAVAVAAAVAVGVFALSRQQQARIAEEASLRVRGLLVVGRRKDSPPATRRRPRPCSRRCRLKPETDGAAAVAIRVLDQPIATILRGHRGTVRRAEFDTDGSRVVTAGDDGTARVWRVDGKGAPVVLDPPGPPAPTSASFNRSGTRILTVGGGEAYLWKPDDPDSGIRLGNEGTTVRSAVFDRDGGRVVIASREGVARIFDLAGSEMPPLSHGDRLLLSAAFDPGGTRIVTTTFNVVHLWTLVPEPRQVTMTAKGVIQAQFANDGKTVVAWSRDHVWAWELGGAAAPREIELGIGRVDAVAVSSDGRAMLARNGRIYRHHLFATAATERFEDPPGDRTIVCGDVWGGFIEERSVLAWLAADRSQRRHLKGHTGPIRDVSFSADCTRVVTASEDETARVWSTRAPDSATTRKVNTASGRLLGASVVHNGEWLITSDTANVVVSSVPELKQLFKHQPTAPRGVVATLSGDRLMVTEGNTLRVWSVSSQREVLSCTSDGFIGTVASFSADGKSVFFKDGTAIRRAFLADACQQASSYGPVNGAITSIDVSPDGRRLLATVPYGDGSALVWDLDDRTHPQALRPADGSRIDLAMFGTNGDQVVTVDASNTVQIWSLTQWPAAAVASSGDITGTVTSATLSAARSHAFFAVNDNTVRAWPLDGSPPLTFVGHTYEVRQMATTRDERYLLTGSADQTTRLWPLNGVGAPTVFQHAASVVDAGFAQNDMQMVVVLDDGTVTLRPVGWKPLLERLRNADANCLTTDARQRYLGESMSDAEGEWTACESRKRRESPPASASGAKADPRR